MKKYISLLIYNCIHAVKYIDDSRLTIHNPLDEF